MSVLRLFLIVSITASLSSSSRAQKMGNLVSGANVSLRALSVVTNKVIWAGGSEGTIGRTVDGGKSWVWHRVPGFEKREFRDIEAFDRNTAVAMAIDTPAIILRTTDGGKTWKEVFRNNEPGMFLDAMEFWNLQSGIVIGDPVGGKFFIARTFDGGKTWRAIPPDHLPDARKGEACFAASGTNIRALDRAEACFVSGGNVSRFFWKGSPVTLPILQGRKSTGANSMAVWFRKHKTPHIMVVGGDFLSDTLRKGNAALSRDGGRTWIIPSNLPYGYRSCVEFISAVKLITCGPNGVDLSLDEGLNWNALSHEGFNVCRKAKKGKAIILAGENGRMARLTW